MTKSRRHFVLYRPGRGNWRFATATRIPGTPRGHPAGEHLFTFGNPRRIFDKCRRTLDLADTGLTAACTDGRVRSKSTLIWRPTRRNVTGNAATRTSTDRA